MKKKTKRVFAALVIIGSGALVLKSNTTKTLIVRQLTCPPIFGPSVFTESEELKFQIDASGLITATSPEGTTTLHMSNCVLTAVKHEVTN